MLKNAGDEWVRDSHQLKIMMVEYFKNLFRTIGNRHFELVLEYYPCLVGEHINQTLTANLSMEEVKMAAHQ